MNTFDHYHPFDMSEAFNPLNVTRTERSSASTAASRQKSCNACVRGKRRCDKTFPKCTRCSAKSLDCVYQKLPPMPTATASSPSESSSLGQNQMHEAAPADFDMSFDMPPCNLGPNAHTGNTATTSSTTPETLALDPNLDFNIADLINGAGQGQSLWDLPGFAEPKNQFPAPVPIPNFGESQQAASEDLGERPAIRDVAILQEATMDGCIATDPLLVHDPRSRIGYVLGYLRDCHKIFAQTRTLPFIHPRLYAQHLPRTMMSAFCAASTYATHTPSTKAWALRVLSEAAKEVQTEGRNAVSVLDKIARVQALVLIDTMRMFDGDISMRNAAEREQSLILEWVAALAHLKDEVEEGETPMRASRDKAPKSWEHWVLVESLRRTIMMSMAFLCLLCVLKEEMRKSQPLLFTPQTQANTNPPADEGLWKPCQAFTASRHLWEASTSVDFFRAWREQPQWGIQNGVFKEFWQFARAEDCDEFTKLMLTTQVGPDAMDHFMQGETNIPVEKVGKW